MSHLFTPLTVTRRLHTNAHLISHSTLRRKHTTATPNFISNSKVLGYIMGVEWCRLRVGSFQKATTEILLLFHLICNNSYNFYFNEKSLIFSDFCGKKTCFTCYMLAYYMYIIHNYCMYIHYIYTTWGGVKILSGILYPQNQLYTHSSQRGDSVLYTPLYNRFI